MTSAPIISISNLSVSFAGKNRKIQTRVLDSIDLQLHKNEVLGIVGESGCGKTTLARCITGLQVPTSGTIFIQDTDLAKISPKEMQKVRRSVQMVFQNPFASLNPRKSIFDALAEPLKYHYKMSTRGCVERVTELLSKVGLDPSLAKRFPHEFSGGQRQRIALARALACNPDVIIADEPVSSLDVSIQAQILNLLKTLRDANELSMIFISHDLAVVKYIAHRVAVMYKGQLVEVGFVEDVFSKPSHPYTQALLNAVPRL